MENKEEKKFDNKDYVVKKYNGLRKIYNQFSSPNFLQMGQTMLSMLNIQKNEPIIEVGCGAGQLLIEILLKKHPDTEFCAVDLTPKMVELCAKKAGRYQEMIDEGAPLYEILQEIHDFEKINKFKINKDNIVAENTYQFKKLNLCLATGSIDDLYSILKIQDHYSCYLSSLCLHSAPDTKKSLQEALNIIRPGGKAIFTVWGEKESSTLVNTVPKILSHFKVVTTRKRSAWHLSNRDELIGLMEDIGFVNVVAWYQFVPWRVYQFDLLKKFSVEFLRGRTNVEEDVLDEMGEMLAREYLKVIEEDKKPIGMNALFVMGERGI